jgi:dipeptidyl-peptidase-3
MAAPNPTAPDTAIAPADTRQYLLERVDEAAVVQLYADGFNELTLGDKLLVFHLYQAAIAGRDIYYDQRYAHNLEMRDLLETLIANANSIEPGTRDAIVQYTKLFWINTGPYNNLTARKFVPACTPEAFADAVRAVAARDVPFRTGPDESLDDLIERLTPLFFDKDLDPLVTNKTPRAGQDILTASANNLYAGVSMSDLDDSFQEQYALNSRLVKDGQRLREEVYRVGGRYSAQIAQICDHLRLAARIAPPPMERALLALIRFYETGEERDRRAYDIAWVEDRESTVDTINGFIEVYMDARGRKGAWEALVYYVHPEKTAAIRRIAEHAQWFEDRMPWDPKYRKPQVTGVTARAIEVVVETGDSGPVTPVGINLPNDQEIRETAGSKSVSLSNVNEAYDKSMPREFRTEFSWDDAEVARAMRWSAFAGELTTNLHEVIGHGSGLVSDAIKGKPEAALKEQFSTIEEARADLVALYFVADPYLAELGLVDANDQPEMVLAEYEGYARNALVQLRRVREGTHLEEDHMRNRQLIVHWLMANTSAIERRTRDGKTYYRVVNVQAFRDGAGRLLAEVQRIKAEGLYEDARTLVETYGVHFDPALRDEVVSRVDHLNLPSYTAFVMPRLSLVLNDAGEVADVRISYAGDLTAQMLEYAAITREARLADLGA